MRVRSESCCLRRSQIPPSNHDPPQSPCRGKGMAMWHVHSMWYWWTLTGKSSWPNEVGPLYVINGITSSTAGSTHPTTSSNTPERYEEEEEEGIGGGRRWTLRISFEVTLCFSFLSSPTSLPSFFFFLSLSLHQECRIISEFTDSVYFH